MMSEIQEDFDRIARFSRDDWNHNRQYHPFLLRHVPVPCPTALDLGCGMGAFSRLLAARAGQVHALDLSPGMLQLARQRSRHTGNIAYHLADALTWQWPPEQFDCIVSIATLHHLPMEQMLTRIKHALHRAAYCWCSTSSRLLVLPTG